MLHFIFFFLICFSVPWWLRGEESAYNTGAVGDMGSVPGSGISPGGEYGNPSSLVQRIPGTEETGRLQSIVLQSDTTEVT